MRNSTSMLRCLCVPAAILMAACIIVFVFVARPLRDKISTESDDIQKFHAKTEYADRKIAQLPEIEAQFEVVKEDERKIPRLLSEEQSVDFIKRVEDLSRAVGGEVSIKQGTELAKKKPTKKTDDAEEKGAAPKTIAENLPWEKQLSLQVIFVGEYAKAVNFLHKIETMPYRLDVVSLDIGPFVREKTTARSENAFIVLPTEEGDSVEVPVEPEKPMVSATFELVVYME